MKLKNEKKKINQVLIPFLFYQWKLHRLETQANFYTAYKALESKSDPYVVWYTNNQRVHESPFPM